MFLKRCLNLVLCLNLACILTSVWGSDDAESTQLPTVLVAILVRNKAHILPWFFYYLENLDYPKERMRLWIRSDHNEDNSVSIVNEWLNHVRKDYSDVDFFYDSSEQTYPDAIGPLDWSEMRFQKVLRLRQEGLDIARNLGTDFLMFVDADNLLLNNQVLKELVKQDRLVIGPMLNTTISEHYSNFWCGMDERGYYKRTDDYLPIQLRHQQGVFAVPMVHSTLLIQLRDPSSQLLAYRPPPDYHGPHDDIIVFAHSVMYYGLTMHVDNRAFYGYMLMPLEPQHTLDHEREQFVHVKHVNIVFSQPLMRLPYIDVTMPKPHKLHVDEVYVINLERRPDRRIKMQQTLSEFGIDGKIVNAVDGRLLNDSFLKSSGIAFLPGFADPYKGRPMTWGEIGCFMSHYNIWLDILHNRHQKVIVFEDDVLFRPFFLTKYYYMMKEASNSGIMWDLLYLGRKRMVAEEFVVEGTETLIWPHYSYWTIGYMLTLRGAEKLIQQDPLSKLIPVDEYLPIMFDRHTNDVWKSHFGPRDLVALSANPALIEPTHYTGSPGYITDTEDSPLIEAEELKSDHGLPVPGGDDRSTPEFKIEL